MRLDVGRDQARNQQLAVAGPRARGTGPLLLPTWLINDTRSSFSLMSSSDVIWVYPYASTRRLFSVIPLSTTHGVCVISRTGQTVTLGAAENRLQDVLTTFYRWAPWAVIGPDPAMEARFRRGWAWRWTIGLFSSKPSRAELLDAVDKRRAQILAFWAAQAAGQTDRGSGA